MRQEDRVRSSHLAERTKGSVRCLFVDSAGGESPGAIAMTHHYARSPVAAKRFKPSKELRTRIGPNHLSRRVPETVRDPEDRLTTFGDTAAIREKMMDKTLADSYPASDPPSSLPNPSTDSLC